MEGRVRERERETHYTKRVEIQVCPVQGAEEGM